MHAEINVRMSFGTFGHPKDGVKFSFWHSDDPKELLTKNLAHFLHEIHHNEFLGATLYVYDETHITLYRYEIDENKFNLTKKMELILKEKTEF